MSKDVFDRYVKRRDSGVNESEVRHALRFWRIFWGSSILLAVGGLTWWWIAVPAVASVFSIVVGALGGAALLVWGILHMVTAMSHHNKTLLIAKTWGVREDE